MIFHIRQKLASRNGNQFYRDKSLRNTETLCGAACTWDDLAFSNKLEREFIKEHLPHLEPCEKCVAIRSKMTKYDPR